MSELSPQAEANDMELVSTQELQWSAFGLVFVLYLICYLSFLQRKPVRGI